ncbi:uncharacterized protein LOC114729374 isoform X1 [Neltuma alba]|uniref:uncharacterized protein LOC114729374 isoform X1 n=1 Tax=Neltuma alba TaxID=207710 RepID=UPI0010A59313|nr:uncharacterized protein LOC114729374 isoform X1 [Prosopis alba]
MINEPEETQLDRMLSRIETFLALIGFEQSSWLSFALSWTSFLVVGVVVPLVVLFVGDCTDCEEYQRKNFEVEIVAFQACLAAVSLLCLSHNLRKYGLRRFLFVDRYSGRLMSLHERYIKQVSESFRLLALWGSTCFFLKTIREIIRLSHVNHESWWPSFAVSVALIISWTYVSTISLLASILFHLICNLQVIHFDDYAKLIQRDANVLIFMEEHIRLRYHLSKISHRFRIYLLLGFFVVTVSQIVTLIQVTAFSGLITFANGGDFAVSTIVQVVGIIICLHAATRISHRAQNIVSLASRWHALATCTTSDASPLRSYASAGSLEPANHLNSLHFNSSESDLESLEFNVVPTNSQLASYMSSHHKRQAFVMYLQTNPGGITIFGWVVDRSLVNTIFFLELTRWLHSWQDHIMMHIVNMYQRAGIVCHLLVENHFV